jgi:predicted DNA-binding transcriptional regulator AlpA
MQNLATTRERQGRYPVSPATLWRWIAKGTFPPPTMKFSSGVTVWDGDQLDAFDAQCVANGYTKKPLALKTTVLIEGA